MNRALKTRRDPHRTINAIVAKQLLAHLQRMWDPNTLGLREQADFARAKRLLGNHEAGAALFFVDRLTAAAKARSGRGDLIKAMDDLSLRLRATVMDPPSRPRHRPNASAGSLPNHDPLDPHPVLLALAVPTPAPIEPIAQSTTQFRNDTSSQ